MNIKIEGASKGGGGNKNNGSCVRLVTYLEKENDGKPLDEQEYFFSSNSEKCNKWEVIQQIDNNGKGQGLGRDKVRFASIILSPSAAELAQIGDDPAKLKEFTRAVMDRYADGFGKGLTSEDVVWYAKIENTRSYTHQDEEVKAELAKVGDPKPGDQRHVHIVASTCARREHAQVIQEDYQREGRTAKISPLTNHRDGLTAGAVKGGFSRDAFYGDCERIFDQKFDYDRSLSERYDYLKLDDREKRQMERDYTDLGREVAQSRETQKAKDHSKGLDFDDFGY